MLTVTYRLVEVVLFVVERVVVPLVVVAPVARPELPVLEVLPERVPVVVPLVLRVLCAEDVRLVLVVPDVRTRVVVVLWPERIAVVALLELCAGSVVFVAVARVLEVAGFVCRVEVEADAPVVREEVAVVCFCVAADCVRCVVDEEADVVRVPVVVREAPDCSTACWS